jgi:hypothetical protein
MDMLAAEDPTSTEEIRSIEMLCRMTAISGITPPAFLWYRHCGYQENWNRAEWNEPTMRRPFDAYMREFNSTPGTYYLTKGWLESGSDPLKEYHENLQKYGPEARSGSWTSSISTTSGWSLSHTTRKTWRAIVREPRKWRATASDGGCDTRKSSDPTDTSGG